MPTQEDLGKTEFVELGERIFRQPETPAANEAPKAANDRLIFSYVAPSYMLTATLANRW